MFSQYRVLSGLGQLVHTLGLEWPEESLVEEKKKDVPEETPKKEAPAKEKSASLYISPLDRRLNNL
jgi:hypothetical protein